MISRSRIIQGVYDATWGKVFAGAYDSFLRASEVAGLADKRRQVFSQASGRTLEIATGTGLNLAYYGPKVTELVLTEPYPQMIVQLEKKVRSLNRQATILPAYAEKLPFPDQSFDTVVASMILCSADDPSVVLNEIHRVLKPGGQYLFLEHVRNQDPMIARRQDRVQPLWYVFGNGCHCNRDTVATLGTSSLVVEQVDQDRIPRAWSIVEAMITGRARRPNADAVREVNAAPLTAPSLRSQTAVLEQSL